MFNSAMWHSSLSTLYAAAYWGNLTTLRSKNIGTKTPRLPWAVPLRLFQSFEGDCPFLALSRVSPSLPTFLPWLKRVEFSMQVVPQCVLTAASCPPRWPPPFFLHVCLSHTRACSHIVCMFSCFVLAVRCIATLLVFLLVSCTVWWVELQCYLVRHVVSDANLNVEHSLGSN